MSIDHDPLPQSHPCTHPGCKNIVPYDDEPKCYDHSPDSGSSVRGYSYRASNMCRYLPITYASPSDAARVITELLTQAHRHSTTTVAHLHELSSVPGHFTDHQWGWTEEELHKFDIKDVESGYELVLPDPKRL